MARSVKKGPYVPSCLQKKIEKVRTKGRREIIKTWKRASMITPDFVGFTIAVHDGRRFNPVFITENMVGHTLGEFASTRTFRLHSGQRKAGVTPPSSKVAAASVAAPSKASATSSVLTPPSLTPKAE